MLGLFAAKANPRAGELATWLEGLESGKEEAFPEAGLEGEALRLVATVNRLLDRRKQDRRRLSRFASAAAHELRNPLASARAHLELALRKAGREAALPSSAQALADVDRLWVTLEALLLLLRGETQMVFPERRALNLASLVDQALALIHGTVETQALRLKVVLDRNLEVLGDPDRLHLLFFKLCDNGARYSPPAGRLRVTLERQGDEAVFAVEDQGPGVPESQLPYLFDYFQPYVPARERNEEISNLGLSLARLVAAGHGGTLNASVEAGRGTRVEARLPALAPLGSG